MPIIPTNGQVDPIFLGIGVAISLIVFALFFKHERDVKKKRNPPLSKSRVDNVETLAWAIACQIRKCKSAEDFNKAVRAIGHYEWQFAEDDNAQREAKSLKELLDIRAAAVYGVETIF